MKQHHPESIFILGSLAHKNESDKDSFKNVDQKNRDNYSVIKDTSVVVRIPCLQLDHRPSGFGIIVVKEIIIKISSPHACICMPSIRLVVCKFFRYIIDYEFQWI